MNSVFEEDGPQAIRKGHKAMRLYPLRSVGELGIFQQQSSTFEDI